MLVLPLTGVPAQMIKGATGPSFALTRAYARSNSDRRFTAVNRPSYSRTLAASVKADRSAEWLATLRWGSTITIAISLAAVAVGLILLFCAWKPGQPNAIVLHVDRSGDGAGSTEFVMSRRSVARLAAGHADLVDGVDSVSATVTSRRITLSVKSQSEQRSQLAGMVTDRVREALQGAGLQPMPKITTTVHTQRL